MISYVPDIHLALHGAQATAIAPVLIDPDPGESKPVEKAVDRTQRADEPAEGTVAEHTGQSDHQHDHPLAGKDLTQLIEGRAVCRMLQNTHRTLQCTGRTDILAESRENDFLADPVPERDCDHEHSQESILEV